MTNVLNIIDLLAIAPFYFELVVDAVLYSANPPTRLSCLGVKLKLSLRTIPAVEQTQRMQGQSSEQRPVWLRVFRLVRVVRMLKLSKYSEGLQLMGKTLYRSAISLSMLLFAEGDVPLQFSMEWDVI
jgi:hypothetical protein